IYFIIEGPCDGYFTEKVSQPPAGFQEIIMLFCIILHLNTEFTIGYFIINFAVMVYSIKGLMD
ncbi:MAG: hypothetical protein ACLUD1_12870, partial [Clostridia bacterium]